ncbi:Astacin [Trichostrongylus colubriformis]|uniref:Astacin n=1 Tax=Trichostrongylus colubriformis TaxID=6319 RepID=A0AAN8FSH6_TRICO
MAVNCGLSRFIVRKMRCSRKSCSQQCWAVCTFLFERYISRVVTGAKHVGATIKNATVVGYKKLTNNTALLKVRSKLRNMKEKVVKTLKQTPQRLKELMEKMKNMKAWFFDRDKINPQGDTISEINNNTGISDDLYQRDIILTEEQIDEIEEGLEEQVGEMNSSSTPKPRRKRQALKDKRYPKTLWTGTVNYYFHPAASMAVKSVFRKAAKMWEKDTCVNFTENQHAQDRIIVYDYGSVMHYGGTFGAKFTAKSKGLPTIVPKDEMYQQTLGSPFISFTDFSLVNEHYHCKENCPRAKSASCQNGGFPHPRDCQKCVCPGGYGGRLCNERPQECGRTIKSTPAWIRFEDVVGRGNDEVEDYEICNYWIESPLGTEIETGDDPVVSGDARPLLARLLISQQQ